MEGKFTKDEAPPVPDHLDARMDSKRRNDIGRRSLIIAAAIFLLSGCSRAQRLPANAQPLPPQEKVLIVYLSRTNNTKAIAEFIHQKVGGTIVALELERPYPADYRTTVRQVVRENETGYLPPLKTKIERIEQYDFVFLGFPTWAMRLPPPIKSFLRQYSLKGKTVIPFNTNAGYGEGSSFQTVKELCPQSTVLEGFVTRGGVERDGQYLVIEGARAEQAQQEVETWLKKIFGFQEATHEMFQDRAVGMRIIGRQRDCYGAERPGQARFGHDSGLGV
ncbi:MAG: flavodoxin family protein [Acidobacteriota bacterium]